MTKPAHDLELLRDATDRLLAAVGELEDAAVTEPSLLPGWTRGHVLTHLARNADALVNVLRKRPMYVNAESRDADIAAGAGRPLTEQIEDLRSTSERLDSVLEGLTDEQWKATVELRNGVTDTADRVPLRRLLEVELHHVDLGIGYTLDELPGAFTDQAVSYLAKRFHGNDQLPALELRAEDGRSWPTGAKPTGDHTSQVVVGTPGVLVGWLAGRSKGGGLTSSGPLPTLPPL